MKLKIAVLSMGFTLSSAVFADTYYGILKASAHTAGRSHSLTLTYKLDLSNKDNITGTLDVAGPLTSCSGEHEIASGSIKDNVITLRTKKTEGFRCGVITFRGEVSGNKFVGKVPWGGVPVDVELEKQN
jgi:hypothetical protein